MRHKAGNRFAMGMASVVAVGALALSAGSLSVPVLEYAAGFEAGEAIHSLLSPLCHQYPSRSLWIGDVPMGLCARCTGGYLGVLVAVVGVLKFDLGAWFQAWWSRFAFGFLLMVPGVTDGIVQLATSYESTNAMRLATGLLGGFGFFLLAFPAPLRWRMAAFSGGESG